MQEKLKSKDKQLESLSNKMQEYEELLKDVNGVVESKAEEIDGLLSKEEDYKVKLHELQQKLDDAESSLASQLQGNEDSSAAYKTQVRFSTIF